MSGFTIDKAPTTFYGIDPQPYADRCNLTPKLGVAKTQGRIITWLDFLTADGMPCWRIRPGTFTDLPVRPRTYKLMRRTPAGRWYTKAAASATQSGFVELIDLMEGTAI